jgi:hypothetical protein
MSKGVARLLREVVARDLGTGKAGLAKCGVGLDGEADLEPEEGVLGGREAEAKDGAGLGMVGRRGRLNRGFTKSRSSSSSGSWAGGRSKRVGEYGFGFVTGVLG